MECQHEQIVTWRLEDTNEPAGLHSCKDCYVKFVPITRITTLGAKLSRYEALEKAAKNMTREYHGMKPPLHCHCELCDALSAIEKETP